MKKIRNTLLSFIALIVFCCCSPSDGCEGESDEAIGLEKTMIPVGKTSNKSVVHTKSTTWCIFMIKVIDENGEKVYYNDFYLHDNGRGDIYNKYKETMSFDWFTVSQSLNYKELTVELDDNCTNEKRTLHINLASLPMKLHGADLEIIQESE